MQFLNRPDQLRHFLQKVGERVQTPARFYLFGGSAILWMGGRRDTMDVDFTVSAAHPEAIRQIIQAVAAELDLDVEESIPEEFMPLPKGAEKRHQFIGQFGNLEAYLFDPYSIALMKIERAFETDIADVHFLLRSGHIDLAFLEQCLGDVANRYEEGKSLRQHFNEMKRGLTP